MDVLFLYKARCMDKIIKFKHIYQRLPCCFILLSYVTAANYTLGVNAVLDGLA